LEPTSRRGLRFVRGEEPGGGRSSQVSDRAADCQIATYTPGSPASQYNPFMAEPRMAGPGPRCGRISPWRQLTVACFLFFFFPAPFLQGPGRWGRRRSPHCCTPRHTRCRVAAALHPPKVAISALLDEDSRVPDAAEDEEKKRERKQKAALACLCSRRGLTAASGPSRLLSVTPFLFHPLRLEEPGAPNTVP